MKVHLRDSDEPLTEGATVIANCGAVVENVRFPFMWDGMAMERPLDGGGFGPRVCRNCIATWGQPRYLYGVVDAKFWKEAA